MKWRASATDISPAEAGKAANRPANTTQRRNITALQQTLANGLLPRMAQYGPLSSINHKPLRDLDHDAASDLPGQNLRRHPDDLGQPDFPSHCGQFLAVQAGFQSFPGLVAFWQRAHHGIDAVEADPAQDKGRN